MPDKYGVLQDKYCYPDTDVLINLLNIRDADLLAEAEAEITAVRYQTYLSSVRPLHDFTFEHLQFLHIHLFQDLYSWAGKVRDVDLAKGTTRFCTCGRVEAEARKWFKQLAALAQIGSQEELVETVADLFCELNIIHPFRDGNGRTQRFFFEELLFALGYDLTWPEISQQDWVNANISGVELDLAPLITIFRQAIAPSRE
ncbi:cell filamentation protein Fic [Rheinheimera riviphila]|uniref:protein adenylyltransferase n=1 Tax=Rheinheimera riviphila TaxID=1834037 RepID=A0A437QRA7_9GAMM|nr:Fic family protein [Rheinheimera riviphila]RVU37040.1 cell filamentation protein Fic [Rheinheimera riviphila]